MKKNNGMALITVLIFLQILAILGLCAIQMALSETKQSQLSWRKHETEILSQHVLVEIEKKMNNFSSECVIPETPLPKLLEKLPSRSSCTGIFQSIQYYYAIELLGMDPCAYIQLKSKKSVANYYRITLLGMMGDVNVILQSTMITPIENDTIICTGLNHAVTAGQQSWKEI
jgi:Tfp pilus assembly protein PilX